MREDIHEFVLVDQEPKKRHVILVRILRSSSRRKIGMEMKGNENVRSLNGRMTVYVENVQYDELILTSLMILDSLRDAVKLCHSSCMYNHDFWRVV